MTMPARLISYRHLLESTHLVAAETDKNLGGFAPRFSRAIDCLLKLPYWHGGSPNVQVSDYHWWALRVYVGAGQSFAGLHQLFRAGFYVEALVVLRHLSEVLVKLAYFANRPDAEFTAHLTAHAPGMPRRGHVGFKTMFDAVAPGYYERWYAVASDFGHGGIVSAALRGRPQAGNLQMFCQYDRESAERVSNQAIALIYGFIARFPEVFPAWTAAEGETLRNEALEVLDVVLRAQLSEFPGSRPWLVPAGGLVGWPVPP